MEVSAAVSLGSVVVLGIAAQWMAARLRLPSILLLLVFGFLAGPVAGLIEPDRLMGDLLFPLVSLSVALILFEGGMGLYMQELRQVGRVVLLLNSLGVLITWGVASLAAYYVLGFSPGVAALQGALLVVTGPTVIGPLLRQIRPTPRASATLKWESIVIDPIGALLVVLVYEALPVIHAHDAWWHVATSALTTTAVGLAVGLAGAALIVVILRRHLSPDYLENGVSLMIVVAAFTLSNALSDESGLVAVTVMGIALINQSYVDVRHIVEFKEHLRVLLLGSLFILLAARIEPQTLLGLGWPAVGFLAVLILVARPLSVWACALGSDLSWRERAFLAWMAPRGIVAASVSSAFALRMSADGVPDAALLAPVTFLVISATVALYGLTSGPVAHWLGVASVHPQGVLFLGAHRLARSLAAALQSEGIAVLLADTNRGNIYEARLQGLPVCHGNVLGDRTLESIELAGIGRLLAMTSNDEANALAAVRFSETFGRREVYQLPPRTARQPHQRGVASTRPVGQVLFSPEATYDDLEQRLLSGATVKRTRLTREFDYRAFTKKFGALALPLFLVSPTGELKIFSTQRPPKPEAGQLLVSLVLPAEDPTATTDAE